MGLQYRGCSHLYFAIETIDPQTGAVTYGTPQKLAPVKGVTRDINADNESIYADNVPQGVVYGAASVTRTFETVRIDPAIASILLGHTTVNVAQGVVGYSTRPDGSSRPYVAIGYALGDTEAEISEVVWAYHCRVNNISKSSNTIDGGTGSEGQSVEVINIAPQKPFETTGERNLDFVLPIPSTDDGTLVNKFFAQVVTPDNAATVLS